WFSVVLLLDLSLCWLVFLADTFNHTYLRLKKQTQYKSLSSIVSRMRKYSRSSILAVYPLSPPRPFLNAMVRARAHARHRFLPWSIAHFSRFAGTNLCPLMHSLAFPFNPGRGLHSSLS